MRIFDPARKHERGVTILIVAFTLLALVAMAVLAIDVASLYQARNEAQRAADAAALAGARMFVSSSYTSTTSLSFSDVCRSGGPGATAAVNRQAEAAAQMNPIAGEPASVKSLQCDNSNPLDPWVRVTVQRASLPTFFARIWGISSNAVTATATAEAYNASGQDLPIRLTNVKPWFIPNCDPGEGDGPCNGSNGYFIDPSDGTIQRGGDFIGSILHLNRQPNGNVGGNNNHQHMGGMLRFYGLKYPPSPTPACPPTTAVSCDDPAINNGDTYIDNIACTSSLPMYCGQPIGPTATPPAPPMLIEGDVSAPTIIGTRCLIHARNDGFNQGQDEIQPVAPVVINGGSRNPNPSLRIPNISRSDSVVTALLFDGRHMDNSSGSAPVIGFLQLGVRETAGGGGQTFEAVVLNAVGCGPNAIAAYPPTNPISVGGASPVPVRLVQTP